MSNGDDAVLDNWEEIDEAGLTNTLQKIQAEQRKTQQENALYNTTAAATNNLTTYATAATSLTNLTNNVNCDFPTLTPMKLLQRTPTQEGNANNATTGAATRSPLDDMATSFQPVMMVLHKPNDEYQSANYTQPISSQTVKILRRPTQSSEPRNNGMRPKQPIKTLQQREQEYAEARLRILGAAKNPEDDVAATMNANATTTQAQTIATTPAAATTTNAISAANNAITAKANVNVTFSKAPGTIVAQNLAYSNSLYQQQTPQQQQQQQQSNYYYQQFQASPQLIPAYNNRTLSLQHQQTQQPPPATAQQQQQIQTWSPVVGGSVSAQTQRQQESVLRMPRGPDGSTGFQARR